MNYRIENAIKKASEYLAKKACENWFGDITVTLTMKDGVPVKLQKTFCEFYVQRKTEKLEVN